LASDTRELLRRLAAGDETFVRGLLTPAAAGPDAESCGLNRRTKVLVRLSALLAADAPIPALRWAVELASSAGVDDRAVVAALVAAAPDTGWAQVVASAPRLASALDFDPPTQLLNTASGLLSE
jgi:hypothetical protein